MKKAIAIGAQSFEKIRQNDCFYIDKTYFIKEWFESNDDVTLITRPRRFGKTLNMDMLNCFLSNRFANRGDLFEGLSIWEDEKYRNIQGTYPVIFLTFAGVKSQNYKDTNSQIKLIISRLFDNYNYLLDSDKLSDTAKARFKDVSNTMSDTTAINSINTLSELLYKHFGKKVIILLDEYDTPLQEAYLSGYWNELSGFIKNLFNNTFKTNPYLDRAVMTGITRISKESFFSDLNNLKVISTTSNKYETCFGFTEEEVFNALDYYEIPEEKEKVKTWYDGFIFGKTKDIYNPWSIINFLDDRNYDTYWTNTSSNNLPSRLIQKAPPKVKYIMQDLIDGKPLVTTIDEQIIFNQLDNNVDAIWSLLLASGYLKPQKVTTDEETYERTYELVLTNREVKLMFTKMFAGWFNKTEYYSDFVKSLLKNDCEEMTIFMNKIALATFSYYDTANSEPEDTSERIKIEFHVTLEADEKFREVTILPEDFKGFDNSNTKMIWNSNEQDFAKIINITKSGNYTVEYKTTADKYYDLENMKEKLKENKVRLPGCSKTQLKTSEKKEKKSIFEKFANFIGSCKKIGVNIKEYSKGIFKGAGAFVAGSVVTVGGIFTVDKVRQGIEASKGTEKGALSEVFGRIGKGVS